MARFIRWLVVFVILGICNAPLVGQPITVVPKPGAGNWTVSYTRMFEKGDPSTGTELSGIFKTFREAQQHATGLQRWSQSMEQGSDWRLKRIYIEGEDANSAASGNASPKMPNFFSALEKKLENDKAVSASLEDLGVGKTQTGKFAVDLLTDPAGALTKEVVAKGMTKALSVATGEAKKKAEQEVADLLAQPNAKLTEVKGKFSDYLSNVQDAYKRAKDAKDEMMSLTGSLATRKFNEVNTLIEKYNRESGKAPTGLDGVGKLFPKLSPVGPGSMKKVEDWKSALRQQFDLEERKTSLDRMKVVLERDHQKLKEEFDGLRREITPFDPADPRVIRLREKLQRYAVDAEQYRTALGSYETDSRKLTSVIKRLHFRSLPSSTQESTTATLSLAGTRWEINGMSFGLRIVEFGENQAVTGRFNVEASRKQGTWKQVGGNRIEGDFGSFGAFTGTITGSTLTVNWQGKSVELFRK